MRNHWYVKKWGFIDVILLILVYSRGAESFCCRLWAVPRSLSSSLAPGFRDYRLGPKTQTRTRAQLESIIVRARPGPGRRRARLGPGRAFGPSSRVHRVQSRSGDRCTDHRPDQHQYSARGSNYRARRASTTVVRQCVPSVATSRSLAHTQRVAAAMAKARGVTVFIALLAAAILACGDEAADGEVGGAGSSSCPAQEACEAPSPPFVGDIGIRYVGSVYLST